MLPAAAADVRATIPHGCYEVSSCGGATTGNHGDVYLARDGSDEVDVEPCHRAIAINRIDEDLPRAELS